MRNRCRPCGETPDQGGHETLCTKVPSQRGGAIICNVCDGCDRLGAKHWLDRPLALRALDIDCLRNPAHIY